MSDNRFLCVPTVMFDDTRVTHTDLVVLLALGRFADHRGWCHIEQKYLANAACVTRETISRRISHLKELGYVESQNVTLPGRGRVGCQYRVVFDTPEVEDV